MTVTFLYAFIFNFISLSNLIWYFITLKPLYMRPGEHIFASLNKYKNIIQYKISS